QHEVMIEAVENHNPEVIVIDEIGRELEALAARTIAERGVQLIGTAHGNTLENLLLNPTLSDLVGGIESVTLSDEEARRRRTQKTVLERRSLPTFDVLIEIQTRDRLAVHPDVAAAVDSLLRGYPLPPELRYRDENGEIHVEKQPAPRAPKERAASQGLRRQFGSGDQPASSGVAAPPQKQETHPEGGARLRAKRIFPYGVARNRLMQAARKLGVPIVLVNDLSQADALVTLRTYYRKRQRTVMDAEQSGVPVYVLRSNTVNQLMHFLSDIFAISAEEHTDRDVDRALEDTQAAIAAVLNGERWVDLPPASAYIRRLQHEMVRDAHLVSHSYGREPYRRVRVYRE
ncbi:MAG: AAA family ATPase, partial [Anaerolineae bacterium]